MRRSLSRGRPGRHIGQVIIIEPQFAALICTCRGNTLRRDWRISFWGGQHAQGFFQYFDIPCTDVMNTVTGISSN